VSTSPEKPPAQSLVASTSPEKPRAQALCALPHPEKPLAASLCGLPHPEKPLASPLGESVHPEKPLATSLCALPHPEKPLATRLGESLRPEKPPAEARGESVHPENPLASPEKPLASSLYRLARPEKPLASSLFRLRAPEKPLASSLFRTARPEKPPAATPGGVLAPVSAPPPSLEHQGDNLRPVARALFRHAASPEEEPPSRGEAGDDAFRLEDLAERSPALFVERPRGRRGLRAADRLWAGYKYDVAEHLRTTKEMKRILGRPRRARSLSPSPSRLKPPCASYALAVTSSSLLEKGRGASRGRPRGRVGRRHGRGRNSTTCTSSATLAGAAWGFDVPKRWSLGLMGH
jgi:hypothetical protein